MSHFSEISPKAYISPFSTIWHFVVILDDVIIHDYVSIGSFCEIGRGSVIGLRSRISARVFLPANSTIGEDCFIGPGVTFTDDRYPKANNKNYLAEPPRVGNRVSIGAGAIILPGVVLHDDAFVGAGSIVTRDVHAGSIIRGEPSRPFPFRNDPRCEVSSSTTHQ